MDMWRSCLVATDACRIDYERRSSRHTGVHTPFVIYYLISECTVHGRCHEYFDSSLCSRRYYQLSINIQFFAIDRVRHATQEPVVHLCAVTSSHRKWVGLLLREAQERRCSAWREDIPESMHGIRSWTPGIDVTNLHPIARWWRPARWPRVDRCSCWNSSCCWWPGSAEAAETVGSGCEAYCTGPRLGRQHASAQSPTTGKGYSSGGSVKNRIDTYLVSAGNTHKKERWYV